MDICSASTKLLPGIHSTMDRGVRGPDMGSCPSDNDSGCALEEYTWVPPGLTPAQVHQYMAALPEVSVPYVNSVGDEERARQLLRQLPPHDHESRYCGELTEAELNELELFSCHRKRDALGRGSVRVLPAALQHSQCTHCSQGWQSGELAVFAFRVGPSMVWHPACFVCCVCHQLLVDLIYFHLDGRVYCGRHHAEQLKPRCAACDELIFASECTQAESVSWHVQHFSCSQCDCSLVTQRYEMHGTVPYCYACYQQLFADICETCHLPIELGSQQMSDGQRQWHDSPQCFRCYACAAPLLNDNFVCRSDALYCSSQCEAAHVHVSSGVLVIDTAVPVTKDTAPFIDGQNSAESEVNEKSGKTGRNPSVQDCHEMDKENSSSQMCLQTEQQGATVNDPSAIITTSADHLVSPSSVGVCKVPVNTHPPLSACSITASSYMLQPERHVSSKQTLLCGSQRQVYADGHVIANGDVVAILNDGKVLSENHNSVELSQSRSQMSGREREMELPRNQIIAKSTTPLQDSQQVNRLWQKYRRLQRSNASLNTSSCSNVHEQHKSGYLSDPARPDNCRLNRRAASSCSDNYRANRRTSGYSSDPAGPHRTKRRANAHNSDTDGPSHYRVSGYSSDLPGHNRSRTNQRMTGYSSDSGHRRISQSNRYAHTSSQISTRTKQSVLVESFEKMNPISRPIQVTTSFPCAQPYISEPVDRRHNRPCSNLTSERADFERCSTCSSSSESEFDYYLDKPRVTYFTSDAPSVKYKDPLTSTAQTANVKGVLTKKKKKKRKHKNCIVS